MSDTIKKIAIGVLALVGLLGASVFVSLLLTLLWNHGPASIFGLRELRAVETLCLVLFILTAAGTTVLGRNLLRQLVEK